MFTFKILQVLIGYLITGFQRRLFILAFFLQVIMVFTSCLTIRNGFIRNTGAIEEKISQGEINGDSALTQIRKEKQILFEKAAFLSSELPGKHTGIISARQLNSIFDNLQENLQQDSMLYGIARSAHNGAAIADLLESADAYNRYFRQNKQIRRTINRGNSAARIPKRLLNKTQRFLLTPSIRKSADPPLTGQKIQPASLAAVTCFTLFSHGDRINNIGYNLLNGMSQFFGNTIGMFNRKPEYPIDAQQMLKMLQPLDIILLKSETHLTDKFIPGFFGHAAVYTGDRRFMETSGFWDFPAVVQYQQQITSGRVFAEGLRSGLQLSAIDQFIDGEIFLIIRLTGLSEEEKVSIISRIFSNISKKYDFNFDVQSPDKVFCSEMIFLVFDQVNWMTHKTLGRVTMIPDEIAGSVVVNPRLQFTGLISKDGIIRNPSPALIFRMMDE